METMTAQPRVLTLAGAGRKGPDVEENREYYRRLLERLRLLEPDLVVLPETAFHPGTDPASLAEEIDGPTVSEYRERANRMQAWFAAPLYLKDQGRTYNSIVLIDRTGAVRGTYKKRFPVTHSHDYTNMEVNVSPGDGPVVFETEFGTIGIQICFDIGFPENWAEMKDEGARMVLWCSAYNGGFPLQAYAARHRYWVVSSVQSDCPAIIDPCGRIVEHGNVAQPWACRDIGTDFIVTHLDFHYGIDMKIAEKYGDTVVVKIYRDDGLVLIYPRRGGPDTAVLRQEFGLDPVDDYFERHRETRRELLAGENPKPKAAPHGKRSQYSGDYS